MLFRHFFLQKEEKKKSLGVTGESHTATSKCPGVNKAASPNEAVIFVWHTAALLPYRAPSQLPIAVPTAVGPKRVETVERGGGRGKAERNWRFWCGVNHTCVAARVVAGIGEATELLLLRHARSTG